MSQSHSLQSRLTSTRRQWHGLALATHNRRCNLSKGHLSHLYSQRSQYVKYLRRLLLPVLWILRTFQYAWLLATTDYQRKERVIYLLQKYIEIQKEYQDNLKMK